MKNCYFAMLLLLSAAFAAGCADDKEEGGNDIKLNPDPTQLSNITLMKATFAADEFLGKQIASVHNLGFYLWLVEQAREHIKAGDFSVWKDMMVRKLDTRL